MNVSFGALEYSKLQTFAQINAVKINRIQISYSKSKLLKLGSFFDYLQMQSKILFAREFLQNRLTAFLQDGALIQIFYDVFHHGFRTVFTPRLSLR